MTMTALVYWTAPRDEGGWPAISVSCLDCDGVTAENLIFNFDDPRHMKALMGRLEAYGLPYEWIRRAMPNVEQIAQAIAGVHEPAWWGTWKRTVLGCFRTEG